jgi:hypothetical protein
MAAPARRQALFVEPAGEPQALAHRAVAAGWEWHRDDAPQHESQAPAHDSN